MITLASTTRVKVAIAVEDDSGSVAALIMALTALVSILVKLGSLISEAAVLVSDFVEAARFTNTLFAIGFKSLAYGLGVRV
jgi:hypothetical protein